MARPSIELITGYTKAGKPQTKKYFAKSVITLFDAMQGTKLAKKLQNSQAGYDVERLTDEEYENLSETEQKEYAEKMIEQDNNALELFNILEEVTVFIADMFGNQFTAEDVQKGIEMGGRGFEVISETLGSLIAGEVDDTKKFVSEKKK
ncbi:hypothetical protein [Staphylococcus intermedius]|uniref:hypothetical protein n=1 Tax=Staphylococcus intermedius TaxID=1285 RepID=UPI000BBCC86E|nr:hypothetical protein [Staphylococcus intermedius]PCF84596.1 hypothetical protein B4W76_11060 [Staphylococcus intermedius]